MLRADNALKNPTVLIVVDRRDLDSQINETFGGADVKNLIKVQSCKKLGEYIGARQPWYFDHHHL
jgi:type I restriction enzyme R subunit